MELNRSESCPSGLSVAGSSSASVTTLGDLPHYFDADELGQFSGQLANDPIQSHMFPSSSSIKQEPGFSSVMSLVTETTTYTSPSSSAVYSSAGALKNEPQSPTASSSTSSLPTHCDKKSLSCKDEGNIQAAADSNSQKQFVPCKVCGDRASGFHYGVTSCEGCKGFFRRSIQKQIEYRCLRDGKCMVIRLNRNRCQYCRFKKCLAVGMSRDSVRYGRVPKRSKSQDDQSVSSSDPNFDQSAIENKQLAIYDIILSISQAHHANCGVTEDKLKNLQRKPSTLMQKIPIPSVPVQFTDEELEAQKLSMWHCLAGFITPAIHSVVEFAKRVSGFVELSQDDQLILIKTGFFEVWLTRMARMFNKVENHFTFEDGSVISKEELAVVFSPDFVNCMFEIAQSFNHLNLNDTEIGLFCAIVLATPDRRGLEDSKAVELIQDRLIEALKLQICRNHSTEENLFGTTIVKLPQLRTLGVQHNEILEWYRLQWHRIRLPPLFSEIFDICKHEDDV